MGRWKGLGSISNPTRWRPRWCLKTPLYGFRGPWSPGEDCTPLDLLAWSRGGPWGNILACATVPRSFRPARSSTYSLCCGLLASRNLITVDKHTLCSRFACRAWQRGKHYHAQSCPKGVMGMPFGYFQYLWTHLRLIGDSKLLRSKYFWPCHIKRFDSHLGWPVKIIKRRIPTPGNPDVIERHLRRA